MSGRVSVGLESASGTPRPAVRQYCWLAGIWVVVALFVIVTVVRSREVQVPFRDPGGEFFRLRVVRAVFLFAGLALLDACARASRRGFTLRRAAGVLRDRWPWQRLVGAFCGIVAYYVVYVCYHNLKSWDAFNTPRDTSLRRVDSWLFFGHTPAVLLHDLFGQHLAAYVFVDFYESFSTLVTVSVISALVFSNRLRDGYVFLSASMWVWILGVASYYLVPSIGPFYSASRDFAGLPRTVVTSTQEAYLADRTLLLQHPGAHNAFGELSAFASLHVGFTCMIALMLRYYGFRWATRVMALYVCVVILATVYLGWHFAVDVVGGMTVALLAVWLGNRLIYPAGRTREAAL